MRPGLDAHAVTAHLRETFPQMFEGQALSIEAASDGVATLRLAPGVRHLRPGNVVSGPTFMMLADAAAYVALLSRSADAAPAVTSNLSISFLSAGRADAPILQRAAVVKAGRRLATIVAEASSEDGRRLTHATLTYVMG
ncbi:MAG: PaaI family thioesterase [Pseudomonadota bacterium]